MFPKMLEFICSKIKVYFFVRIFRIIWCSRTPQWTRSVIIRRHRAVILRKISWEIKDSLFMTCKTPEMKSINF